MEYYSVFEKNFQGKVKEKFPLHGIPFWMV